MPGTGGITETERACRRSTHALLVVAPRPSRALQLEGAALDGTQVRALGRWVEAGGRLLVTLPGRDRLPLVFGDGRLVAVGDLWLDADVALPDGAPSLLPSWRDRPRLY